MIPFEVELSDIKVKDLHIIILSASESLNPGELKSFQSVNGTHFVLLHMILLRAILNQEKKKCREVFSQLGKHSVNVKGHKVLAGNIESNFKFKNAAVAFTKQQLRAHHSFPLSRTENTMLHREGILLRHLKRPGEHPHLCHLG